MINADRLREVLSYSPNTGQFVWRIKPDRKIEIGSVAGGFSDRGYWRISVDGRKYLAHRLAWLYMTGEWPIDQVDHINGNRADNSWANLRAADNSQNSANSKRYKNNTSGIKGVCWDASRRKWIAQITVNYKQKALGRFESLDEAAAAYAKAASELFGEFARAA